MSIEERYLETQIDILNDRIAALENRNRLLLNAIKDVAEQCLVFGKVLKEHISEGINEHAQN